MLAPRATRESLVLIRVAVPSFAVRALGAAEMTLGVVAAVWPTVVAGTLVAVVYGGFCLFVLGLLVRNSGRGVDCGCFGGSDQGVGWLHVALNAFACAVAAAGAAFGVHGIGWILGRSALVAPAFIIGALAATYAAYVAYTLVPRAWGS